MPTVHWKRYTAHCVCLCCCPSGQIWQTLSRRWTGQCGACSTCAATVATQREQRYAKGEIVIDGKGGEKDDAHWPRQSPLCPSLSPLLRRWLLLFLLLYLRLSCSIRDFFIYMHDVRDDDEDAGNAREHAGSGCDAVATKLSGIPFCTLPAQTGGQTVHPSRARAAPSRSYHCPLSTVHDSLVPRATCNELSPPAVTKWFARKLFFKCSPVHVVTLTTPPSTHPLTDHVLII